MQTKPINLLMQQSVVWLNVLFCVHFDIIMSKMLGNSFKPSACNQSFHTYEKIPYQQLIVQRAQRALVASNITQKIFHTPLQNIFKHFNVFNATILRYSSTTSTNIICKQLDHRQNLLKWWQLQLTGCVLPLDNVRYSGL